MSTQHLSRRVVLKGLGATVALPWLESLTAVAGERPARTVPPKRFAFMFFGDGIHPAEWWSRGNGATMELGPAFLRRPRQLRHVGRRRREVLAEHVRHDPELAAARISRPLVG